MAPDIAAGGGAAEVATKDFGAIAGLYEANNANALRASEATAANATHASIAGAQIANQSSMEADRLGEQRRQFDQSRGVSERDNWMANVQAHAAQQHAQLNAWLQGQELSQSESMRLQRMQNAVGDVQARDDLDDTTKNDLIMQLKTGIDPLRQRQEASKAKFEQAQMDKVMHADAQEEVRRGESNKFWSKNAPDGSLYLDQDGNVVTKDFAGPKRMFMRNHAGDPVEVNKPEKAAAAKPEKPWDAPHEQKQAETEAEMIVQKANPTLNLKHPETQDDKDAAANVRSVANQIYHERRQDYQDRLRAPAPQGGPGNTPPTTNQPGATPQAGPPTAQQAAPQAPPPPPTEGELKAMQPFDRMKPETMAPAQKQMMAGYSEMHGEIRLRRDLPEKQRWAAEDAMTDIMAMVERYGSVQRLPPAEKAKYDRAKAIVSKLPPDPYASTGNANAGLGVGGY